VDSSGVNETGKFLEVILSHYYINESGVPNFAGCRIELDSKLNIPVWRSALAGYHDNQLVDFLQYGFPLGYSSNKLPVSVFKNHSGALSFHKDVDKYLATEVQAGVMAGPFINNPLSLPLSISPLNTVPKKDPGQRRVISDLSYPPGSSVNDGIPEGIYLGEAIELSFPSVDDYAARIREVGSSALLFKKDLKRAYRQFKVDPGDAHLLGYNWKGSIYIDLALAMGVRSAAFLCQRVTSAIAWIYASMGFHLTNYLDDLAICIPDHLATQAYQLLAKLLVDLGVEEAIDKSCSPAKEMEFLGVSFNVDHMTMSVTEERVQEILSLVNQWLHKRRATKRQLQSLIGKLQFVAKCVRAGRIFISRLLQILPTLRRQHHYFYINSQFKKDLIWWRSFLVTFNGITIIPEIYWSDPDARLSTDACLSSIGGWCNNQYFSCMLPQSMRDLNYDINVIEMYAILIGLKLWSENLYNTRTQIWCDNLVSVTVLNSGRTKDPILLTLLREIAFIAAKYNFQIRSHHIRGSDNRLSDLLSRAPVDHKARSKLDLMLNNDWEEIMVPEQLFNLDGNW
jgi:hypothetical protein